MKQTFTLATAVVTAALALSGVHVVSAQVPAQTLKSISIPDKVNTPIGTLEFFDGVPIGNTVQAVYDNLDRSCALGVYLDNIGAVSIYSVLAGLLSKGPTRLTRSPVFEQLMDSQVAGRHSQHLNALCLFRHRSGQ